MSRSLPRLLAGLVAAFLALGLFSQTVFNTAHNEQMYVAAGYLLAHGRRLYADFAFVQMPYSAWLYAAVFSLTGGSFYLLKAKLVNYLCMALAAGLLARRSWQATRDGLLTLLLLIVLLANYYLLRATIEASNYTLPLALSLLAYGWLLAGVERRARPVRPYAAVLACFGAGVALGAAAGAKLYYAALVAPFGLVALLYPQQAGWQPRALRGLLPLALGVLVGLGPALVYAVRDWGSFAFNNLGYHLLNTQWRVQNGFTDMGWNAKLETARDLLTNPNLAPLLIWLALAGLLWARRRADGSLPSAGVLLAGSAALVALVTAFTPRPLFPQYFVMPVPFFLLWVAEWAAGLDAVDRRLLAGVGAAVALVAVLAVLPRHTASLRRFAGGAPWAGAIAVRESETIRSLLHSRGILETGSPAWVATLSPGVALESDLPFYPQLATGAFVYRIGDLLAPEERARFVATSPTTLAALLDAQPPAAIFVGEEGELETPLLDYAQSRGYIPAPETFSEGQLYLR
jgi:hypothetical protein